MSKQYMALLEGKEVHYLTSSDGKKVFSSLDEVEQIILNNPLISGAKVYEREVTDWNFKSEIMKEK